jgi:hypothetical protein
MNHVLDVRHPDSQKCILCLFIEEHGMALPDFKPMNLAGAVLDDDGETD